MSVEPSTGSRQQAPANQPTTAPATGSDTPVLDRVGQQQGSGQSAQPNTPSESRLAASDTTKDRLARELHNGRTGSVNAWLRVGIERRLGKLASIGLEFGLKLAVNFDNDRRVRASIAFDVRFQAAVDLLLFKAGLSFDLGGSIAGVWNSPDHFYAFLQQRISEVEKASDTYLTKQAGAAGKDEKAGGNSAPTPTLDGTPTMGVSTSTVGLDLSLEKGKLMKRMPWLNAVGSLKWESFQAHRTKDGKRQELHGTVARGITKLETGFGSAEVEYSVTDNHPNPDQNGVFWDLRLELGRGNAPKVKASEVKALEAQMKVWSQAAGTNPVAKAKAWLKAAEAAVKASAKAPVKAAKVQPDLTLHVHVQWNGASEANTLRFIHVHTGKRVVAKGELPLGAATLTGEVGIQSQSEVLEVIGTQTLAYTKNVFNGFKRRHDHPKDWNAWTERHKAALWALFGQVNVAGSQPAKEAKKRLKAAASQSRSALTQAKPDAGVFATLLAAITRDFVEEGNEADWKTVVDPKKPVTAEVEVSGSAGKTATYSKARLSGRLVKKPKTLRDVHDQGVDIKVSVPDLKSAYRGSLEFRGKQPSFASDTVKGLKGHFPSRGRNDLGYRPGSAIEGLTSGLEYPTSPGDFDRWGPLADRLLDGVVESVLDPHDPTQAL